MPAFFHERCEVFERTVGTVVVLVEQPGPAACAKLALACAHAEACSAAKIYQIMHMQLINGIVHFSHAHLLAFTHKGIVGTTVRDGVLKPA